MWEILIFNARNSDYNLREITIASNIESKDIFLIKLKSEMIIHSKCTEGIALGILDIKALSKYLTYNINWTHIIQVLAVYLQSTDIEEVFNEIGINLNIFDAYISRATSELTEHHISTDETRLIEEYESTRKKLVGQGHKFYSDTDSEIIAHLISRKFDQGMEFKEIFVSLGLELKGAFAAGCIF